MDCERCKAGAMEPERVRRFSPPLVAFGSLLWIPALLILVFGTIAGLITIGGVSADAPGIERARAIAVGGLKLVDGMPPAVVSEFETSGRISPTRVEGLRRDQQMQVQVIVQNYETTIASLTKGDPVTRTLGRFGQPVATLLIPIGIAGWIFTLRKQVWRCPRCRHVIDPD